MLFPFSGEAVDIEVEGLVQVHTARWGLESTLLTTVFYKNKSDTAVLLEGHSSQDGNSEDSKVSLFSGFIRSSYFFQTGILPQKGIHSAEFTQNLCLLKSSKNPVKNTDMS